MTEIINDRNDDDKEMDSSSLELNSMLQKLNWISLSWEKFQINNIGLLRASIDRQTEHKLHIIILKRHGKIRGLQEVLKLQLKMTHDMPAKN